MDAGDLPSIRDLIDLAEGQSPILGLVLLGAGVVFMMLGVRIFNVVVPISFGMLGFGLGASLPVEPPMNWAVGGIAALGLGLLSRFMVKIWVAILAGIWAGYAATIVSVQIDLPDPVPLALGGLSLVIAFALAFAMFEQIVAFVTSMEGAVLFMAGLIMLLSQSPTLWINLRDILNTSWFFGPFLILAGTVTGFYLQLAEVRKKESGASG